METQIEKIARLTIERYGNYGWRKNVVTIPVHGENPGDCELCDKQATRIVSYEGPVGKNGLTKKFDHYVCDGCFDDPDFKEIVGRRKFVNVNII